MLNQPIPTVMLTLLIFQGPDPLSTDPLSTDPLSTDPMITCGITRGSLHLARGQEGKYDYLHVKFVMRLRLCGGTRGTENMFVMRWLCGGTRGTENMFVQFPDTSIQN